MKSKTLSYVDFEKTNLLLEGFNKTTGFVTAILDFDGNVLSQSGWRQICSDFHRKNSKTAANCTISDTLLSNKMMAGEKYHIYKCMNGLIDVAMPIIIRGEHVANLFSGQFFFDEPDIDFFKRQAQRFGFEEKAYLDALMKVPVVSKEEVEKAMDFLIAITQTIIEITIDKMEHMEINEAIKESEIALSESNNQLEQIIKDLLESQRIAKVGTWRLDLSTNHVVWSKELYKMYGFDPKSPVPPFTEHMKLFTPKSWRRLSTALNRTRATGVPYELELETVNGDGSNGWMWVRGEAEKDSDGNITSLWGAAQDITKNKRVEFATKQSEERFQLLFDKAPMGYQSLDIEGCFIEVNQQWLDTLGYSKEEVIGKWFGDFLCPEYVEGFRKRFPIFKSQGYIHSEFDMLTKDGKRITMSFEGKIGYDSEGDFKQTHCILQNITDQRKAEKALIESEERYKCLFEFSGVGIGYYTTEGIVISYNQKAMDNMGGKLEDYIGKSVHDLFSEKEAKKYFKRIKECMLIDQPMEYEDYLVLNSTPKWFASTFSKVKNSLGEVIGIQIASLDITERKIAEVELNTVLAQNQRILDNLQDSYFQVDLNGNLAVINPQAVKMFGFSSASELIGKPVLMLYADPEDRVRAINALKSEGVLVDLVIQGLRKDKATFWVSMNVQFIKDENGNVIGTEGLVRDITDRIDMQKEIELQRDDLIESNAKLNHMLNQTVETIAKIGELRDAYTAGHQKRVQHLACAIAEELELSEDTIKNLLYASLVHDIGKMYVPSDILNKPGKLTDLEFQIIQTHVEHGYNIIKEIDLPDVISTMVHQHHERLDGSGYPQGLSGEQIILESRILAVADVVEAMTSHRPYRPMLGIDVALEEITTYKGQKYDSRVVDTCVKLFKEQDFNFNA